MKAHSSILDKREYIHDKLSSSGLRNEVLGERSPRGRAGLWSTTGFVYDRQADGAMLFLSTRKRALRGLHDPESMLDG